MSVQCLLTTDCVTPDAGYATALLTTRLRQLCLTGNNKRAIHSAGVTIPYIKCDGILHLNFEIGGDFWRILGLYVPNGRKNRFIMRILGLFVFLMGAKIGFLMRKLGLFASWRTNFWVFWRKNMVNIFGPIQDSHPCQPLSTGTKNGMFGTTTRDTLIKNYVRYVLRNLKDWQLCRAWVGRMVHLSQPWTLITPPVFQLPLWVGNSSLEPWNHSVSPLSPSFWPSGD